MGDGHTDDKPSADELQQQVLARSGQLQMRFLHVLNDPVDQWALQPLIVAHAIAETLGSVLAAVLTTDPSRLGWTMDLLEHVRQHLAAAAVVRVVPGETEH
ncbi:MAG: hypothetical protein ABI665_25755 [Vicinamibacterales bacterium]